MSIDDDTDSITSDLSPAEQCRRLSPIRRDALNEKNKTENVSNIAVRDSMANGRQMTKPHRDEFKLKGYKLDERDRIVCLDCDKIFKRKNSYNIHKRMFVVTQFLFFA